MITKILDSTIGQAHLVFCVAFIGISIHALAAEPPLPKDPVAEPIAKKSKSDSTQITAETSSFDSKRNLVVFEGNVVMTNPEMRMNCDLLEVNLIKNSGGPASAAAGGIQSGVARGYVVIKTKNAKGGEVVAHARRADFESAGQSVVLSDHPVLQDGKQLVEGTSSETRIFLTSDGKHRVTGSSIVTIVDTANSTLNLPK